MTWAAPSSNGGAAIDRYAVQRSTTATGPWANVAFVSTLSYTNTGLSNGVRYYYRVVAHNAAGWGAPSTVVTTVVGVPAAPRSLVTTPGNRNVRLTWTAPSSAGATAIDRYAVQRATSASGPWSTIASTTTPGYTNTGLTNGVRYYFRVVAHNRYGYGPASTAVSAIPRTLPSAPRSPAAIAGNTSVRLTWVAPTSNGGAAIDRYAVQRAASSTGPWTNIAFPTTLAYTNSGLSNGVRYHYRILAHNAAGWSPASTVVSAVPRTVPGAPPTPVAVAGNGSARLSWTAPASNGGAAIDSYAVQRWEGSTWITVVTVTGLAYTNVGLAEGTTYNYRVLAHNPAGWGAASATVSVRTPSEPGPPTGLTATPGDRSVTLRWQPPSSDGGSALIAYDIWNYHTGETRRVPPSTLSYVWDGLQNGSHYAFTVRAVNSVRVSTRYAYAEAVPATTPGIPVCTQTRWEREGAGTGHPYIFWTSPGSNGGHQILGYRVWVLRFRDNAWSVVYEWSGVPPTSGGSFVFSSPSVEQGFWYSIHVAAYNDMGLGPTCMGSNVWGA